MADFLIHFGILKITSYLTNEPLCTLGQVNKILLAQFPHLHKDGFNHAACLTVFMTIKQNNLYVL